MKKVIDFRAEQETYKIILEHLTLQGSKEVLKKNPKGLWPIKVTEKPT